MSTLVTRGWEAQVRDLGAKRSTLVVFVHGNGLSKSCFRESIRELFELPPSGGLHCLSLDLPGHGTHEWSGRALDEFTRLEDFAPPLEAKVNEYCRAHGREFDAKVLVAHSIGCHMALFAQKRLAFGSALLIEPIVAARGEDGKMPLGVPPGFAAKTRLRRSKFPSYQGAFDALHDRGMFKVWQPECVRDYVFHGGFKPVVEGEPEVELACNPNLEANIFSQNLAEIEPELKNIRFPRAAVVLAGSESMHLSSKEFASTAAKLNAEFVLVPGINHVIMCEAPKLVAEHVNRLL